MSSKNEIGISIEAKTDSNNNDHQILLRGRFSVSCGQNGVPDQPLKTLKHVVVVVTRSASYQAFTPFKEVVVFDDDVQVDGNTCSAFFNVNVMDHLRFDGPGDYYILCSLGTNLSNIVKVTIPA